MPEQRVHLHLDYSWCFIAQRADSAPTITHLQVKLMHPARLLRKTWKSYSSTLRRAFASCRSTSSSCSGLEKKSLARGWAYLNAESFGYRYRKTPWQHAARLLTPSFYGSSHLAAICRVTVNKSTPSGSSKLIMDKLVASSSLRAWKAAASRLDVDFRFSFANAH